MQQRPAVDAVAAKPVAEPAEEELPGERIAEHDAVHSVGGVGRLRAVLGPGEVGVVDAAEHKVVVVPLRLGGVKRGQHLQLLARLQGLDVPRLV